MSNAQSRITVAFHEDPTGNYVAAEVKDTHGTEGWGGVAVQSAHGEREAFVVLGRLLRAMAMAVDAEVAALDALDMGDVVTIEETNDDDSDEEGA